MPDPAGGVTIVALTHDLVRKLSIVSMRRDDDATKNIVLPVPFGCGLDALRDEAENALRAHSAEAATLAVRV